MEDLRSKKIRREFTKIQRKNNAKKIDKNSITPLS